MKQVNLRICQMILPLFVGLFLSLGAYAQQITVKGHVKDATGEPVIGANVVVKGTATGTITDFNGDFTLAVPQGSTLSVSFVGYQETEVKAAASVVVTMQDDTQLLETVVVIGYGTVKKNDATGSVTAFKPDNISKGVTTSMQDMMSGKIAGVSVISDGGKPGGAAQIRIRGGSSLNASNDPLIVIDGLALDNDGVKGMSNGLGMVNPGDIETYTVLKDASATAIYGSRASNGVIIITTKKGAAGSAPKVTYDGNVSAGIIAKKYEVMDGDEYRAYIKNLYGETLPYALGTANTDWQDQIYRTAISTDHNVTVSGGLKNMPYRVSVGFTDQNGILKTSNFQRFTASVNLAPSFFNNYLKFNFNAKAMYATNRYADDGVVGSAIAFDPTRPVTDPLYGNFGGYWQWTVNSEFKYSGWPTTTNSLAPQNPVALLNLRDDSAKSSSFIGNAEVDYKFHFFPDLRVHASLGGDYSQGLQTTIVSPYSYSNNFYGWDGYQSQYKYNLAGNIYLQYYKELSNQSIDVMAGAEQQHFHRHGFNPGTGVNPVTGELNGEKTRKDTGYATHSSLVSYFGRANYILMNKYMLTATIRMDGSSRFPSTDNLRMGWFPSAAFGWKMKEEAWLKDVNFLSELKLRLGWGMTGQQNITDNDFPYLPQYVINRIGGYYQFGDEFVNTYRPKEYNTKLKWEETTTYNAGVDFGFLNGRINGSVDYYFRRTNNLINKPKIPVLTNFSNELLSNIGTLDNQGVEFTINAKPIVTKDFTWDVGYNITYNHNEITKLNQGQDADYVVLTGDISHGTGSKIQAHKVGYAASSFYVYQQVYDADGKPIENMFVDRNGDGIVNADDRYIYKKPSADVLMGLTSKMIYKNWDLSFALRASFNNYVYNDVMADRADVSDKGMWSTSGFYSNRPKDILGLGFSGTGDYYMSDYFVQNASFLRCDNITVGYSFKNVLKADAYKGMNGRIYATVQNPFVITAYDGLDPEMKDGIDRKIYPRPMTFLLGVSLQF